VERVIAGEQVDGHRGRWGVVWFVVAVAACVVGPVGVALLFAALAGVAALQTAAAWRRARRQPVQLVAGVGAVVLTLSALLGIAMVGLVALLYVAAAVVVAVLRAGAGRLGPGSPVAAAGLAVRCGFFLGVTAASVVLIARTDKVALLILLVLVSGYEVGNYLVGTGASTPVEGPVAGIVAVGALTFGLSVFQLGPFESRAAWVFGGLAAVLTPLGVILASTFVPTAAAAGPALRRLDSWVLVGPVWAWVLWGYLGA